MGTDELHFRDTTQDALVVANFNPIFGKERIILILSQQTIVLVAASLPMHITLDHLQIFHTDTITPSGQYLPF